MRKTVKYVESDKNFEHIKLLYKSLFVMSEQIKDAVLKGETNVAREINQNKDSLITKILRVEKTIKFDDNKKTEYLNLKKKAQDIELKNLEIIKSAQNTVSRELTKVSKARKLINAYNLGSQPENSIDISDMEG